MYTGRIRTTKKLYASLGNAAANLGVYKLVDIINDELRSVKVAKESKEAFLEVYEFLF